MIRNLKALGLALMAFCAIGVLSASAASAQTLGKLTSSDGQAVTLTGEDTGAAQNWFEVFGQRVECPNSTYTGHKKETTPHQLLENGATEVTVTPHYRGTQASGTANCDVIAPGSLFSATVTMNGCDYVLRDFTTVATEEYSFRADVICPGLSVIEVDIYNSHTHSPFTEICRIRVGPQEGLAGGRAKVTPAANHIDIVGTLTEIKATQKGICPHKETSAANGFGKYGVDVTIFGHNSLGEARGVRISD